MLNHITYNCFEILIQCVSVSVSFSRFSTIRGYLLFVPPVLERLAVAAASQAWTVEVG